MNEEWQIETILLVTSSPKIILTWYIHLIEEELPEALKFPSNCSYFLPCISLAASASTDGLPFVLPPVIWLFQLCHLTGAKRAPSGVPWVSIKRRPPRWLQRAVPSTLMLSTFYTQLSLTNPIFHVTLRLSKTNAFKLLPFPGSSEFQQESKS